MANLKRIMDLYEIIKQRLPSTFPKALLSFHESEDCMLINTETSKADDESTVFAVVNADTLTINIPILLTIEYENHKTKETLSKEVSFTQQLTDREIVSILLHEIGHLYAAQKYGKTSKQFNDEGYADEFARRWMRLFRKEKLI